jgi:hypothetical protein
MRRSYQPFRSRQARMNLAWLAIVSIAGMVLFAAIWLADRTQEAAIDSLSTSSLPPPRH